MIDFISHNFISITPIVISLFALYFSIKAYKHNVFNSKVQSYYQKASYRVFLVKISFWDKLWDNYSFKVKLHNSLFSDSYPFPYKICITPNIGGIARAQTFDLITTGKTLGIDRTLPSILNKFKKFDTLHKGYAYHQNLSFIESDKYPYFCFYNEELREFSRYHFCIEITDFNNNSEVWYVGFSLVVNRDKDMKVTDYEFKDINIVSPKDIIKNLYRILSFNKGLDEIKKEKDFDKAKYDLQLFEMKTYFLFLKNIKSSL